MTRRVVLAATFLYFSAISDTAFGAEPALGVVATRPVAGRFVEHDGVFLVPYEETIPGAKVTIAMEPVPGGVVAFRGERFELAPYWVGKTEVTWGQYRPFMGLCAVFEKFDDRGVRQLTDANRVDAVTAPSKLYDTTFTFDAGEAPALPAVSMSQYAAKQYTKWLSLLTGRVYRLPADAEWLHAARGEGKKDGDTSPADEPALDDLAWHEDNSDYATQPVGQKLPSPLGLHDTLGNASEWALDALEGKATDADGAGGEPPVAWPTALFPRVLRGGSALLPIGECNLTEPRASNDTEWLAYDPNTPKSPWWFAADEAQDVGFRLLRPYEAPDRATCARYWDADMPRIQKIADHRIDNEGRGERGPVDPDLPAAIEALKVDK
ncbi:MAG: formylglycine-generating enzyme family protein [Lacipirellulaceae bacterium]